MERFDIAQIEQLKEIGAYLRQLREEHSLSLDEIATRTYVPIRMLRALENGQFDILPEPVFVRGFIRRYAEALGLDGISVAKAFPLQTAPAPVEPAAPEAAIAPTPVTSGVDQIRFGRRSPSWIVTPVLLVLGAIAVGGIAYAVISNNAKSRSSSSTATVSPTRTPAPSVAAVPSSSPAASSVPATTASASSPPASPTPSASPSTPTGPVTIDLRLSGQSWVRVRVDGKVAYEGMMAEGTQRTWSGQREITVRAGNAGAVSVAFNQGTPQVMGPLAQVADKTFTPSSNPTASPVASPAPAAPNP